MRVLTLASTSPRRSDILRRAGIAFTVLACSADESINGLPPEAASVAIARRKAMAARELTPTGPILAADTLVSLGGEILTKPRDPDHAFEMLQKLSGRWHDVYTGVCLLPDAAEPLLEAVHTRVRMAQWSSAEIRAYIQTGEPMDKAGAYAIQGRACAFIEEIQGDPYSVEGLPASLVWRWLKRIGAT